MKKCAIIIGVNNIKGLTPLTTPQQNAQSMEEWAKGQDFDFHTITDQEDPVTLSRVMEKIDAFVSTYSYDQMVIYFSGHGILMGPGNEVWLLSGAGSNPSEAINLSNSIWQAYNIGITNIIFISDACRSMNSKMQFLYIMGSPMFMTSHQTLNTGKVDVFYATRPGNPALEIQFVPGDYKSIFTERLLYGLNGHVRGIIQEIEEERATISAVPSYELNEYLQKEIPQLMTTSGYSYVQYPQGIIASRAPTYISKVHIVPERGSDKPTYEGDADPGGSIIDEELQNEIVLTTKNIIEYGSGSSRPIKLGFHTGINIIGSEAAKVLSFSRTLIRPIFSVFHDGIYYDLSENPYGYVFVQLDNGVGIPIQILHGYIATLIFLKDQLININYVPNPLDPKRYEFVRFEEEFEYRRAGLIAATQYGLPTDTIENNELFEGYLSSNTAFDPTLSMFTAYNFAKQANFEGIRKVFKHSSMDERGMLFDIKLLNSLSSRPNIVPFHKAEPSSTFPLLTQGWSYLKLVTQPKVIDLSNALLPGLWTTITPNGMELLTNYLRKNNQ